MSLAQQMKEMKENTLYVISLSSGISSAIAADRVIELHGIQSVRLVFMDTLIEDDDNYRFLEDLECLWGKKIIRITEGRTPLQVAFDEHIIPNQKIAPCTKRLKIVPFLNYLDNLKALGYSNIVVVLGIGPHEKHRIKAPTINYNKRGYNVSFPLLWEPMDYDTTMTLWLWDIEPPRMYKMGYSHANCGGCCVKQGQKDWKRTFENFRERYGVFSAWEFSMRSKNKFSKYAFLRNSRGGVMRPMSLLEFYNDRIYSEQLLLFPESDNNDNCFCNVSDIGDG